jgi:hypothetical protein
MIQKIYERMIKVLIYDDVQEITRNAGTFSKYY